MRNLYRDNKPSDISGNTNPGSSQLAGLFDDILNGGLCLRMKVTGRSMAPFLKGGEVLTIRKVADASLRMGDLLFFRNVDGHPILHRIVSKRHRSDGRIIFKTKGDALFTCDKPVMSTEVMGKVCQIDRPKPRIGKGHIDMESHFWKNANYLLAVVYGFEAEIYYLLSKIVRHLRLLSDASAGSKPL